MSLLRPVKGHLKCAAERFDLTRKVSFQREFVLGRRVVRMLDKELYIVVPPKAPTRLPQEMHMMSCGIRCQESLAVNELRT